MPWADAAQRKVYYERVLKKRAGEARSGASAGLLARMEVRSQSEVARLLGMSRQAVHQTERRALFRLRAALEPWWREFRA